MRTTKEHYALQSLVSLAGVQHLPPPQPRMDGNPAAEDKGAEMTEIAESTSESGEEDSVMEVEDIVDPIDRALFSPAIGHWVETGFCVGHHEREEVPVRREIAVGTDAPRFGLARENEVRAESMPPAAKLDRHRGAEQAPVVVDLSRASEAPHDDTPFAAATASAPAPVPAPMAATTTAVTVLSEPTDRQHSTTGESQIPR